MTSKGYPFNNNAWCADFVNFATGEALGKGNRAAWYEAVTNKSYCPTIEAAGRAAGVQIPIADAKPGDLVMFDWDGDGVSDHIGIFAGHNADGTISVLEGNTSNRSAVRSQKVSTVSSILSMRA
jgi:cell wall-associated NlpC family hydrolase